jgi:hypothetical protein
MLNELHPNAPPEHCRRLPGIGVPEVAFGLGFVCAVAGIALVSIALALVVAGTLAMVIAWRSA